MSLDRAEAGFSPAVERVLDGIDSYDGLDPDDQARVREEWSRRVESRLDSLDLVAEAEKAGATWSELDEHGQIVTHRPASIGPSTTTPWTREREKSLWLHHAVLGELVRDPEGVVAKARSNIERWRHLHRPDGMAAVYMGQWSRILDSGLEEIIETLASRSERASELRQNTPFAGVLDDTTRRVVIGNFVAHWSLEHEND